MQPPAPAAHLDYYTAMLWTWSVDFVPRLVTGIVILIVGYVIAAWAGKATLSLVGRSQRVDPTVQPVIAAALRYAILVLVIVAALGQLGIQTASLLAVLGAAGLAIGLALQGTLTNIAAGIMLLWLRPFRIGDYIEVPTNNIAGRITDVGLFVCNLETVEGVFVFAPNSSIWNAALRNQSRNPGRLISFSVALPPTASIDKVRELLQTMLAENSQVLKPEPEVFLDSYDASTGINMTCAFRVGEDRIGEVQRQIIEEVKRRLEQSEIGAPKQITRVLPLATDLSRLILN
jgi:small conductance mechanosensitive channel